MKAYFLQYKNTLVTLLSLSIIALATLLYILRVKVSGHYYGNTDFFTFYESMRFYFSGQNIYSPILIENDKLHSILTKYGNLNPPFFTILLLPLYFFNYANALEIWTLLSLLSLFISIHIILNQFKHFQPHRLIITAGFLIYIVNSESISYGQVSNFILLLIAGSWVLGRTHKDVSAGILIALACAIKLFCGLFLIYFLVVHRFKLFFSAVITGILIFLITLYLFGIKSYISYLNTLQHVSWYAESWSVSFKSFIMRIFSPTENNFALFNFPHLAQFLIIFLSISLVVWLIKTWSELTTLRDRKLSFDCGFSLVILSMLLLSPLGWTYYFNIFIIPYLLLIKESRDDKIHLTCCFLLFINSFSGSLLKTYEIKNTAQILYNGGIGFYVMVIMLILTIRLSYQRISLVPNQNSPQKFISIPLWWFIYGIAFVPSVISQLNVIKNMIELSV